MQAGNAVTDGQRAHGSQPEEIHGDLNLGNLVAHPEPRGVCQAQKFRAQRTVSADNLAVIGGRGFRIVAQFHELHGDADGGRQVRHVFYALARGLLQ